MIDEPGSAPGRRATWAMKDSIRMDPVLTDHFPDLLPPDESTALGQRLDHSANGDSVESLIDLYSAACERSHTGHLDLLRDAIAGGESVPM